jgi:hypothetical protein
MENKKLNRIFAALSFAIPLIIYYLTLAPDVMFIDSGELAGVCVNLGIAHSTGYPLFTILGYLWSLLPMGIPKIMQINLFSAVATSLSTFVFYLLAQEFLKLFISLRKTKIKTVSKQAQKKDITSDTISPVQINEFPILLISFIVSLIFAFGRTVWGQATSIEVYSLQIVVFNLILYLMIKLNGNSENLKAYIVLAFVLGIGFSNHMNTLLILPAVFFIYFFGFTNKPDFNSGKLKNLLILTIPFIIGLSFYLYLPIRSMTFPDFNWGWVHRSWDKFFYHVSGKQYQIWMFSDSESISKNFGIFIENLPFEFAIFGLFLMVWGAIELFRTRGLLLLILIIIGSNLFYSLNYSINDINNYFILSYIALSLLLLIGLYDLYERYKKIRFIEYSFILLPALALFLNYQTSNDSKNYMVSEYTKTMVNNLEKDAIIISRQWDYFCSAFWYKQNVEGLRKDVILIEKEILRRTWYIEQIKKKNPEFAKISEPEMNNYLNDLELFESGKGGFENTIQRNFIAMLNSFIEKNIDKRPIYVTLDLLQDAQDMPFLRNYNQIPTGFAIKIEKGNNVSNIDLSKVKMEKFISSYKNDGNRLEEGIKEVASNNITNLGMYSLVKSNNIPTAIEAFELALKVNPENTIAMQNLARIKK